MRSLRMALKIWCLRRLGALENLVRLDGMPFVTRVASLPELAAATRISLIIDNVDLLEVELMCHFQHKLNVVEDMSDTAAVD